MFDAITITHLACSKLEKGIAAFTDEDKQLLECIETDNARCRYSKFLMWNTEERKAFLSWLKEQNVNYFELSDEVRWAYEDAYSME